MTKAGTEEFDAVVVGAGAAGMYMLHRLRGLGMRAVVLEAGDAVGGRMRTVVRDGLPVDVGAG